MVLYQPPHSGRGQSSLSVRWLVPTDETPEKQEYEA